jgi:hypothetical protein
MLGRCFVLCALILAPGVSEAAQPGQNLSHFGRNLVVPAQETVGNATCFLCSAAVEGRVTGSVHVYAGDVFQSGQVAGNVLVFGGNLSLAADARIDGRVLIFGGHFHQGPASMAHPPTVISALIFLPAILLICLIFGGLIVFARRMVRGPFTYPPLPRL